MNRAPTLVSVVVGWGGAGAAVALVAYFYGNLDNGLLRFVLVALLCVLTFWLGGLTTARFVMRHRPDRERFRKLVGAWAFTCVAGCLSGLLLVNWAESARVGPFVSMGFVGFSLAAAVVGALGGAWNGLLGRGPGEAGWMVAAIAAPVMAFSFFVSAYVGVVGVYGLVTIGARVIGAVTSASLGVAAGCLGGGFLGGLVAGSSMGLGIKVSERVGT